MTLKAIFDFFQNLKSGDYILADSNIFISNYPELDRIKLTIRNIKEKKEEVFSITNQYIMRVYPRRLDYSHKKRNIIINLIYKIKDEGRRF